MTPEDLKTWRESRNMSQVELAHALGWTRDMVAGREFGRVPIEDNIETLLASVATPAKREAPTTGTPIPHGARALTMDLEPLPLNDEGRPAQPLPLRAAFWKLAGGTTYNLMQVARDQHGRITPLCTFLQLDTSTWRVRHVASQPDGYMDQLNAYLDKRRPELEQIIFHRPAARA